MGTKKQIIERHDFISDIILESRINSRDYLLDILDKNDFQISKYTLEKDLKYLKIGYDSSKKCFSFKNENDHNNVSEKKLRTILNNAGIKNGSTYKVFSPMVFSFPYIITKSSTGFNKNKLSPKYDKGCIYNVLLTCKPSYEQSLFNVINEKLLTNSFISAQINFGSVNFLFDKRSFAKKFYDRLNHIIIPSK